MRQIFTIILMTLALMSCKQEKREDDTTATIKNEAEVPLQKIAYTSFGKNITATNALAASAITTQFESMAVGDSLDIKMIAKVDEVCQAKGCWMKLNLSNEEQVMVKFKDYGFFMPKDISGKEVIINGKAFVNEVPVDEQRHYAEDGGATAEEIAAITEPKKTLSFLADGVLLKIE